MYGLASTGVSVIVYGVLAVGAVGGGVLLKLRGNGRRRRP